MKLKNQVVSLEIAKKLKELRVKQDSLYYWVCYIGHCLAKSENIYSTVVNIKERKSDNSYEVFSAFTVAELGELLPDAWHSEHFKKGWAVPDDEGIIQEYTKNEADARGKMLIYLIENKLMEIPSEKRA